MTLACVKWTLWFWWVPRVLHSVRICFEDICTVQSTDHRHGFLFCSRSNLAFCSWFSACQVPLFLLSCESWMGTAVCKEQTGFGIVIGFCLSSLSPASSGRVHKGIPGSPTSSGGAKITEATVALIAKTWHVITTYIYDIPVVGICFLDISLSGNLQCFLLPPGVVCLHIYVWFLSSQRHFTMKILCVQQSTINIRCYTSFPSVEFSCNWMGSMFILSYFASHAESKRRVAKFTITV